VRATTAVAKTGAKLLVIGSRSFQTLVATSSVLRQALKETSFRFRPEEELAKLPWSEKLLAATIDEIMSAPIETLADAGTIADAFRFLAERRRGNIPLVGPDGKLAGIVTRVELYQAVIDNRDLSAPVRDIGVSPVTVLHSGQTVRNALAVLRRKQLKHVPVVDADGRPIGMLSYLDIALAALRPTTAAFPLAQQSAAHSTDR
jgi:CBS domain-containing protein